MRVNSVSYARAIAPRTRPLTAFTRVRPQDLPICSPVDEACGLATSVWRLNPIHFSVQVTAHCSMVAAHCDARQQHDPYDHSYRRCKECPDCYCPRQLAEPQYSPHAPNQHRTLIDA